MSAYTLGQLAVRFGCELRGSPDARVLRVADLHDASPDAICFYANPKYRRDLHATRAGAVILDANAASDCQTAVLIAQNPHAVFARVASLLHPNEAVDAGVHASASVDIAATVDPSASVGPMCVVGAGVRIGPRSVIGPGSVVMRGAEIGADTRLIARVTIGHDVTIGERCIVHPGAVVGSDGFGNANDQGVWLKVPQVGSVRVGNDVEIGANTTIDRGAIGDTVIEDGVKLDNLIQIGHNVRIGAHTAMAAGVGIAGSAIIGKHCMIAGKVGIAGHIEICDRVVVLGHSTVSGSITKPGSYSGTLGLEETSSFRRNAARFRQLDKMAKQLRRLAQRLGDEQPEDETK